MILSTQVKAMNHNNVMNGHKKRLRFQLLRTLNKTSHGKAHFFFSSNKSSFCGVLDFYVKWINHIKHNLSHAPKSYQTHRSKLR